MNALTKPPYDLYGIPSIYGKLQGECYKCLLRSTKSDAKVPT